MRCIIDGHCDLLSKLAANPGLDFASYDSGLDVTLSKLRKSNVVLQCFAIWVHECGEPRFSHVLNFVDLFYRKVAGQPGIRIVSTAEQLECAVRNNETGAMLTLEGVDALEGELSRVQLLYDLGVRMVGITWNNANWAADGVMEPRQGGFTGKGKELVKLLDRLGMIIDVSHLTERGFWELAELSALPAVASHSNAWDVCPHPRNLKKEQIEHLIRTGGMIGINFYPPFVHAGPQPSIDHLIRHIEYIADLGGFASIGLGSDFDGISGKLPGLEDAGRFDRLAEQLDRRYAAKDVERILYRNWYEFLRRRLPQTRTDRPSQK